MPEASRGWQRRAGLFQEKRLRLAREWKGLPATVDHECGEPEKQSEQSHSRKEGGEAPDEIYPKKEKERIFALVVIEEREALGSGRKTKKKAPLRGFNTGGKSRNRRNARLTRERGKKGRGVPSLFGRRSLRKKVNGNRTVYL